MAQTIEIQNNAHLERLLTTSPEMEKRIRSVVRRALSKAQKMLEGKAMPLSTKEAYKAVRKAVYKKVLGGNLNIISGKRRSGNRAPLPPESDRKRSHERGGNRIPRSSRTEDLLTYSGEERGFILRFLNDGTNQRTSRYGNRGSIDGSHWFVNSSTAAMMQAAADIDQMLDQLIQEEFKNA